MPDWLVVVILGIIEGITEFLPISSTGHLLIAQQWLPRQSDFFNVGIQSAAVIAVIPLFQKRFEQFFYRWREPATRQYFLKLLVAFVITGTGGLILKAMDFTLPDKLMPVALALILGGLCFIAVEFWLRGKSLMDEVTWTVAIAVGVGQLIAAVFPGTSRSGTTIVLALLLGLSRPAATEFSFLVSIPTMLAAGSIEMFQELREPGGADEDWAMFALAAVISAIVSFAAVKWLLRFVQSHTFIGFGWYRIAIGALLLYFALQS